MITAVSVDSFKNRLDKIWANEEFSTTRLTYLAIAVSRDASKSCVAFLLLCTVV